MEQNYKEVAEQIFNLVDNDKDKVNDFYTRLNSAPANQNMNISQWFKTYVKPNELQDLFKSGENENGLINWIQSSAGQEYFHQTPQEITAENIDQMEIPIEQITSDKSKIHLDIEDEDEEIMSDEEKEIKTDMEDGEYSSNQIDNDDEIEMALKLMDDGSDDIDILFDITGSDEDVDNDNIIDDSSEDEECEHKKRIKLDHHINKVVESIDDEEEVDRFVHKKYYVMKKKELGSTERMNELEDELDRENISYYDFGKNETIAIKIYCQNEVKINRLLERLDFDCRCVDIAHYTDDWNSTK